MVHSGMNRCRRCQRHWQQQQQQQSKLSLTMEGRQLSRHLKNQCVSEYGVESPPVFAKWRRQSSLRCQPSLVGRRKTPWSESVDRCRSCRGALTTDRRMTRRPCAYYSMMTFSLLTVTSTYFGLSMGEPSHLGQEFYHDGNKVFSVHTVPNTLCRSGVDGGVHQHGKSCRRR